MTDVPAVAARSLYRFFRSGGEETVALREVSVSVAAGELVAVVGPSGSGKSTLLACLAGLDEPDAGSVLVEGEVLSHRPEAVRAALRAERIGILPQSSTLFEHLTVLDNVRFVQSLAAGRTAPAAATGLLAEVGLAHRAAALPGELSGGETARAGIAVALAGDPAVLLADEPTGELDSAAERDLLTLLSAAAQTGVAVVVASHSDAVAAAADRVVGLDDGRVTS